MPPTPLTPIPALQKSPTEYLKLIDRHRPIIVKTHTPASLRSDCPPWHGMSGLVWRGLGGHFAVERVATLRGIRIQKSRRTSIVSSEDLFGIKIELWTKIDFSHISSCGYAGTYPQWLTEITDFLAVVAWLTCCACIVLGLPIKLERPRMLFFRACWHRGDSWQTVWQWVLMSSLAFF